MGNIYYVQCEFLWYLASDPQTDLFPQLLVLAGIGLVFFLATCTVLCFTVLMRTVLLTQGCFSYC